MDDKKQREADAVRERLEKRGEVRIGGMKEGECSVRKVIRNDWEKNVPEIGYRYI